MSLDCEIKPLKILFVGFVDLAKPGGDTTHVRELVKHLRSFGHRVIVVANASAKVDAYTDFHNTGSYLHVENEISRFAHLCVSLLRAFLINLFLVRQVDLVYGRDCLGGLVASLPAWLWRKPMIYELNGIAADEQRAKGDSSLNRLYGSFLDRAEVLTVARAQAYVAVTEQIRAYLVSRYRVAPERVVVIPNGVNTNLFCPFPENAVALLRQKLGLAPDAKIVVFAGTFSAWQGVDTLLSAAPKVLKVLPQAHFLIIGTGPLEDVLRERVKEVQIDDHVTFTGRVAHETVPAYLGLAAVCVAPFTQKRNASCGLSPVKIYEYLACEKNVITSRLPGLAFLEEEQVGYLIPCDDEDRLTTTLLDALSMKDELRRQAGQRGRKLVEERFRWEHAAEKVEKHCVKVLREDGTDSQ